VLAAVRLRLRWWPPRCPVLVGGASGAGLAGRPACHRLHHNVNSFAVNVASLLGLGMAIDYGLFW
jgi:RND superfamily putative drug exporter